MGRGVIVGAVWLVDICLEVPAPLWTLRNKGRNSAGLIVGSQIGGCDGEGQKR